MKRHGIALLALLATASLADVYMPRVISSKMVLQRGISAPVWGWADEGEEVTVEFAGQAHKAMPGKNGKWMVTLAPLTASAEPREMTIKGKNEIRLSDILVGEVWLASGQSNMEWPFSRIAKEEQAFVRTLKDNQLVRAFHVDHHVKAGVPMDDTSGRWKTCKELVGGNLNTVSAVGFFFAHKLQQELGVPVAILDANWGGQPIEQFIPEEGYKALGLNYHKGRINPASAESMKEMADTMADAAKAAKRGIRMSYDATFVYAIPHRQKTPNGIYNSMIAPLTPYAISGAIWYQGESNRGTKNYFKKLQALSAGWSQVFNAKDIPLYQVQIAPFDYSRGKNQGDSTLCDTIWAAQYKGAAEIPGMEIVAIHDTHIDIRDIHPAHKRPVGERLAAMALGKQYGKNVVATGPSFASAARNGSTVIVAFHDVDQGLATNDGKAPSWFELSGDGKTFVQANAAIRGNTVEVSAAAVPTPKFVRMGWADIAIPNLKDKNGWPVFSFPAKEIKVQNARGLHNSYGIIPKPLSIEGKGGQPFEIKADTALVYHGNQSKACAEYLQERIAQATGMTLALKESAASNAIMLTIDPAAVAFAEKDAYTFESSKDRITITGKSASGLFYGIQTLFQLLPAGIYSDTPVQGMKLSVDALLIKDKPSLKQIRGLLVDISRHFRTKEDLFTIIDTLAMHKLNTLHMHLTDSEGWRVEIKAYPKLTTVGAIGNKSDRSGPVEFLTQQDIREIVAYAKRRFVSIIPEIDMPGHIGSAIRAYPELKAATELRDPGQVMRIDEKGLEFCQAVLREVDALFDSEFIHIGCDEVNFFVDKPIYAEEALQEFVRTMTAFIKDDLKKTPITWDDTFEKGFRDPDTVIQWWRYGNSAWWAPKGRPLDEGLNAEQQPFILSPAHWTYFDMPNVAPEKGYKGWAQPISTAEVYNWDPFEDMFGVTEQTRDLVRGAIACNWSEAIKTMKDFGDRTYPRLAGFCERLWSGGKSENPSVLAWEDYRDSVLIPYQLDRYDALGVWYWSKDKPELLTRLKNARKKVKKKAGQ